MNEAEKKADEIIEMYSKLVSNETFGYCEGCNRVGMLHCAHADTCGNSKETSRAKQCALNHVNGKLNPTFIKGKRYDITLIEILFWQEVKTIIENK